MNKKGQAAMEFLMTYGWAILVVIAAIAALAYFGVLDPSRLLPEKCEWAPGLTCLGGKAALDSTTNTMAFPLKNNQGFPIDITSITVDGGKSCTGTIAWNVTNIDANIVGNTSEKVRINNDQQAIVYIQCGGMEPGKFDEEVTITYVNNETTLSHPSVGTIRGRAQ